LLLASPIYQAHSYTVGSVNLGKVQYADGFQRENFAKYTLGSAAINPDYHVNLSPLSKHKKSSLIVLTATGAGETVTGGCQGDAGVLSIGVWDHYLQTKLLPSLSRSITPHHFPLFLFYDVVLSPTGNLTGCCIIGYHSAFANPKFGGEVETYATGDYDASGSFTNLTDISALTHEVGEWMDDPFVKNHTPAWGHTGQVSGCQDNLEVGDPLSGRTAPLVPVTMPNGITYHGQELAFRDWFYRTTSVGLNGWFSSRGTFTADAGPACM
jgi:hypothetical protein